MVNLNKLTVPYIIKLGKELNITFESSSKKDDKIKTILNAGISNNKLEELFSKYFNQYQASKGKPKKAKKKSVQISGKLEERVNLLEDQVKYLMSKIDNFEVYLAKERSSKQVGGGYSLSDVQKIIKSKVPPGNSISIDEVMNIKKLRKYPKSLIEKAIIDLIDDEIFDGSEGRSSQKIQGHIARIIRR
jgi:hypothetical protein